SGRADVGGSKPAPEMPQRENRKVRIFRRLANIAAIARHPFSSVDRRTFRAKIMTRRFILRAATNGMLGPFEPPSDIIARYKNLRTNSRFQEILRRAAQHEHALKG